MIVYAQTAGHRPERTDALDHLAEIAAQVLHEHGWRCVWFGIDEGVITARAMPCCYGAEE